MQQPFSISKQCAAAFTLVELLVVVSIIVVLIAMLVPAMESAVETARRAKCAANLRTIHAGIYQYAMDNFSEVIPCAGRTVQIGIGAKGYAIHRIRPEDPTVDWPAALASVGLASASRMDVYNGEMEHEPTDVWTCPTRGYRPSWSQDAPADRRVFYVGYQYLGGVEQWRYGGLRESRSPVRMSQSSGSWVLAADTTARIGQERKWGGRVTSDDPFPNMPSHPADRTLRPAGGNQVHVDGSAAWIDFDDMALITTWYIPAAERMFFFQQRDTGGWQPAILGRDVPGNP